MTIAETVVGLTAQAIFSQPVELMAQSTLTPDAALQHLIEGNARFASGHSTSHEHDLEILKRKTLEKQEPFASVLTCADSRIPVELVFDQTIGHIFVNRIAGNIVTSEIMASIEYGAAVLGTKILLVMGHARCGAVKAAIECQQAPGQITALYPHLQPAVDKEGSNAEAVTRTNARIQADLLRESSPVLSALVKDGKLHIKAAYYDVGSGKVELLD
jgi:carbonic anhydrase